MQNKDKRLIAKNSRLLSSRARWRKPAGTKRNQDSLLDAFKNTAKDGTMGRGTLAKRGLTPTTTIRLDKRDIELAKRQTEARGLRYQTYLKMLINQALRKESVRAGR